MVAPRESPELAKMLIEESCKKQSIQPGQLSLHADRGSFCHGRRAFEAIWADRAVSEIGKVV